MSGHKNFNELADEVRARPGAAERIAAHRRAIERQLTLADLRKARELTQTQLAAALGMTQPGVSRIEGQADVYLSTLRSYVRALGGDLTLVATFPDGAVSIGGLGELDEPAEQLEHAGGRR